ncbi:MAG: HAD family hydrolase [Candidatus Bathyarchaeota archaeon]|nr:MAG: HAD family hydrolase [Candidatus Bathyarchaeota archaeon]
MVVVVKAIVFDVDGVLIDSTEIIAEAYEGTAKKLGLRIPSTFEVAGLMGRPLSEIVEILWPRSNAELYMEEYRRLFMDESLVIPAIEGAVGAVRKIREYGFRVGILSGKIAFFIRKHLEEAGFNMNWFEAVVSFETTKKHKPDPEPLLFAINKLGVKPEEAIYVGDAISDYECARDAKVEYFAVLTGSLRRKDLEKLGVRNVVQSVVELPACMLTRGQT